MSGVDRSVIVNAVAKAQEQEYWRLAVYQPDREHWLVPSRSVPGAAYVVTRNPHKTRDDPWWEYLTCDCPTWTVNHRAVCVHKAAVALHFRMFGFGGPIFRDVPRESDGASPGPLVVNDAIEGS